MGETSNAFSREIGKNAGKALSNFLFGDSHSTPYRRVHSAPPPPPKLTKAQLIHEANIVRIEAEKEVQLKMLSEQKKQHKAELDQQERFFRKQQEKEHEGYLESYISELQDELWDALDLDTSKPTLSLINQLVSNLETKKWHNKLDVGTKSLEKNKNRLENELANILLLRLSECLLSNSIELGDSKRKYYTDTLQKFERRKSEGLYSVIGANVGFLAKKAFDLLKGLKSKETSEDVRAISELKENTEQTVNVIESSIFFDLNENDRISNSLSNIWVKYANSVDKNIINRKPIFSADGVIESILFVGINPSYEPNDDNVFLQSDDGKSMLYGSLYQRDDAPDYFKRLEDFSEKFDKGYTHINLLYARENDRDFLLKTNGDFIREQLELTYETIVEIKPLAIFFFGSHCKNLIFGADRWIDPKSEKNGYYFLNGKTFPVFFSEDIAFMQEADKEHLINSLRLIIR